MSFTPESLGAVLAEHTPSAASGYVLALSGGADSACLLTALAELYSQSRPIRGLPLRAVHVDHALQPASAEFKATCAELCRNLRVPLTVLGVTVEIGPGVSIEAAARDARYAALALQLRARECLLTAHHAQDQAETLMLQLLRGAGLPGLSAMPLCRAWHAGWQMRPLLGVAPRDLRRFGAAAGVTCTPDPMNLDMRFDRPYLRAQVWPLIEARWPGAVRVLPRAAAHVAQAQELLDADAAVLCGRFRDGGALTVTGLRSIGAAERVNVVRHWIAQKQVPLPSAARLAEALRQMIDADSDHHPAVIWNQHALRRYRNRLFLTESQPPRVEECAWTAAATRPLNLGRRLGSLQWSSRPGGLNAALLPDTMAVRRRRGGETLRPRPGARTQSLQHLCQRRGVLPWMRDALPLVYAGADLIAVGDLWEDARWLVPAGTPGVAIVWSDAPVLI